MLCSLDPGIPGAWDGGTHHKHKQKQHNYIVVTFYAQTFNMIAVDNQRMKSIKLKAFIISLIDNI